MIIKLTYVELDNPLAAAVDDDDEKIKMKISHGKFLLCNFYSQYYVAFNEPN
jgi:hypothetical protein